MSDKRKQKPRKVRRPKFEVIDGHKLTREQYQEYEQELHKRRQVAPIETWEASKRFALRNVLFRARPSVQALKRFETFDLWGRLSDALSVLGGLKSLPLCQDSAKLLTMSNGFVLHVADELRAVEQELRAIHCAVTREVAHKSVMECPKGGAA